ncbi:hypothetical protein PF007_g24577 [Phytophthora fragariae]|uniref:Uncharacterized protein n=1 Tax=Phytophthora fragariae TaxID=53985 RepID=A0A6A3QHX3_9STRA|nr:hypothetical protein PF007_g24577 [Phytophthora fragariae]KAE9185495.1 hypothetical protein PF004_g23343 [Phytophthora fragariae]
MSTDDVQCGAAAGSKCLRRWSKHSSLGGEASRLWTPESGGHRGLTDLLNLRREALISRSSVRVLPRRLWVFINTCTV